MTSTSTPGSPGALLRALLGSGAPLAAHAGYILRHAPAPAAARRRSWWPGWWRGWRGRGSATARSGCSCTSGGRGRPLPLPLPPELSAEALLAAEAARVAIGDVVM
jgi:hypothetical protein